MIDILPRSHAAIYNVPSKKLGASFYWALAVAVLLHLAIIYYLLQANFTMPADTVPPQDQPTLIDIYKAPPPPKPATPTNTVRIHIPSMVNEPDPTKTIEVPLTPPTTGPVVTTTPPATIGTTSGPSTTPKTEGPAFIDPVWTQFPNSETLSDYYPSNAIDDNQEGSATVQCTVLNAAGQVACVAVSETPKGYGFGATTARMVSAKGRVDTSKGNVRVGSVLRKTVAWQLKD